MSFLKFIQVAGVLRNVAKCNFRACHHVATARYAQAILNFPETKVTELDNGFKIATETTDSPTSTVGVWIDAGSRYETKENNGVANFFEHLTFKSTNQHSQQDLEKQIRSLGAQFNSYTDREETAFYAKCLSMDAAKVVDILGDVINNTIVDDEVVEAERKVILKELDEIETDLRQVTFDFLHLTAYQGTPLEKSVFGPSQNIQKITKDDISYYKRNSFVAPRMVLSACGNINHDELVKAAEKSFGSVPNTYTGEIPVLKHCRFTGSEIRARDDWYPFAHIAIAVDTCGLDSPDIYPLMLAKTCIGNWDKTLASSADTCITMVRNIYKEKGCHSFESFHKLYRDTGLWGCYFVVNKMVIDDFLFNLQNEWMKLCINVTEAELSIAKNMLRSNLLIALDNSTNVCADIGRQILMFGERMSFDEIDEKIESVTLQQLRDTCSKYIYDRCPAIAAVGPIEALPEYVRIRSNMYWLRY